MEEGSALFVPVLNATQKAVLAEFLEEAGGFAFGITSPTNWGLKNYDPWWHIFTDRYIEGLLTACGFEVLDSVEAWGGRSKYFLAKKVPSPLPEQRATEAQLETQDLAEEAVNELG
jgi:hypothetical protein